MRILHAGCGREPLPAFFEGMDEVRLDIDESVNPDVVTSLTSLGDIGEFDHIWCSHVLEHLAAEDAQMALSEFHRVLKVGGTAIIVVPDTEGIEQNDEVLFVSPGGPITGNDIHFGKADLVKDNPYMRHAVQFTQDSFKAIFNCFKAADVKKLPTLNLLAVAIK